MTNPIDTLARRARQVAAAPAEIRRLHAFERFVPLGHFYSPETSPEDLASNADRWFPADGPPREIPGVDLRVHAQLELLESIAPLGREMNFPRTLPAIDPPRYWSDNEVFLLPDALVLAAMLRRFAPARVIEIGSGFSSAVMLDTRDRFLSPAGKPCHLTFIEPYPGERLNRLLRTADRASCRVLETLVQSVPIATFDQLAAGDVLFIDSSHVSKIGSDVNHLFLDVLPRLAPGVIVHVHDIFADFAYPRHWLEQGRRWNEGYLLRAFLQYNDAFEILLFNNYLGVHEHARFARALGLPDSPPQRPEDLGAGIWLRKRR